MEKGISNPLLIKWVKENYPIMDVNQDSDLSELDYFDMDAFASWMEKKIAEAYSKGFNQGFYNPEFESE